MSDITSQQLVVFSLGSEEYALPIGAVHEIIRYTEPRSVASDVPWIRGVIGLRGKIIPIYDLAARIGLARRRRRVRQDRHRRDRHRPGRRRRRRRRGGPDRHDRAARGRPDRRQRRRSSRSPRSSDRLVILLNPEGLFARAARRRARRGVARCQHGGRRSTTERAARRRRRRLAADAPHPVRRARASGLRRRRHRGRRRRGAGRLQRAPARRADARPAHARPRRPRRAARAARRQGRAASRSSWSRPSPPPTAPAPSTRWPRARSTSSPSPRSASRWRASPPSSAARSTTRPHSGKRVRRPRRAAPPLARPPGARRGRAGAAARPATKLVVIASSTGGPKALGELIPKLPSPLGTGSLIVQHMPAGFTASLATRLDGASQLTVREAAGGETLEPGVALLAPGGAAPARSATTATCGCPTTPRWAACARAPTSRSPTPPSSTARAWCSSS